MSLRHKVVTILITLFLLFGALDYGLQQLILAPSFLALEREEVQKNVDRAVATVLREAQLLAPSATDWAVWDDTYRYLGDRNRAYAKANLNDEAMRSLKVNVLAVYDVRGNCVWGRSLDLETGEAVRLDEVAGPLPAGHPLLSRPESKEGFTGLFRTADRLLLVAGHPVLTSAGEGPSRGTVLLGRFLDDAAIRRVADQARLSLSARAVSEAGPAAAWAEANAQGIPHSAPVLQEGSDVTRATTVLGDLKARPALELHVDTPRAITARGRSAVNFAGLSLGAAALGVLVALMILLRRMVLDPIDCLTRHAVAVGEHGDLSSRLELRRRDELGTLSREFDHMVARLAEMRRSLQEQSYKSGIAETASGVLHNIGNAVTPLKVGLENLLQKIRAAPVRDFELALTELARPDTGTERRALLEQFVELAGRELAAVARQAPEELAAVSRQVDHVQEILADQERFSRAARVLEPLSPEEIVKESVGLLGEELRRNLVVETAPSIAALDEVCASRVALQQVVVNLLVNAAEAVRAAGREGNTGRLTIDGGREEIDGSPSIHLRFLDNGVGVPKENLTRIFDRGFSTKARKSSGLGLHWSAVTVNAMGGRLFAESDGPGLGACLHLILPAAHPNTAQPNVA